jgi:hypothetical protein
MNIILNTQYFGNSVKDWMLALTIMIGSMVLVGIFAPVILRKLKRVAEKTDNHIKKKANRISISLF